MDDLKRQKIQYAHRKVQQLAVELMKVQRIFRENDSSIKNELISNAVMQLIKCDNLNNTIEDLDQFFIVDGISTHQISSQL